MAGHEIDSVPHSLWTRNCFGTCSVYTVQPRTSLQSHFIPSHVCAVHACLAVTCHLHLSKNDQDLLRATALTRGWNGYRNETRRKLTLKWNILPPLLPGFEPETFRSRVRHSNYWALPALPTDSCSKMTASRSKGQYKATSTPSV